MSVLRFGPLCYLVPREVSALPELATYVDDSTASGRTVELSGRAWSEVGPILADLVARDGLTVSALVLHAGAVDSPAGVVLLLAPPGTGKSTRVAAAGARAVADNSVLVEVSATPRLWSLPFAGGAAVASPSAARERVALVAALGRGDAPRVHALRETDLAFTVTRAVVWPHEDQGERALRARLTLDFVGKIRGIRLDSPPDARYLSMVDQLLRGSVAATDDTRETSRVHRSPNATFREIDGQVVVISVDVHRVRLLNAVGAFIWQRCDGQSVESMVDDLCTEFAVTRDTALTDVLAFVRDMQERGLVTVAP